MQAERLIRFIWSSLLNQLLAARMNMFIRGPYAV